MLQTRNLDTQRREAVMSQLADPCHHHMSAAALSLPCQNPPDAAPTGKLGHCKATPTASALFLHIYCAGPGAQATVLVHDGSNGAGRMRALRYSTLPGTTQHIGAGNKLSGRNRRSRHL